jgi:hypothetical protein
MKPIEQLWFEAAINRWLFEQFGWQHDPDEILF